MAKEVHGQQGGRGAAKESEEEQRCLGDATGEAIVVASFSTAFTAVADGFPLVDTIGEEGQQIDHKEVIKQDVVGHR